MTNLEVTFKNNAINAEIADEAYGSAFYYGNLTKEEWVGILRRMLDEAWYRGFNA